MKLYRAVYGLLLLMTPLFVSAAGSADFRENVAYERILPQQPTADPEKVEVVEVFWYGCPHCHRFQPYVERWLLTADNRVDYQRLPAILNERWAIHARAFYTAEALGVTEQIHQPLFDAIHDEDRPLNSEDALADFFAEHADVDPEQFRSTFNSFAINSKVERARELTRRYQVSGTPAVVVNGKYLTGPAMAGSFERLVEIMDHLVDEEAASLKN